MNAATYLREKQAAPGEIIECLEDGTIVRQAKPEAPPALAFIGADSLLEKSFERLYEPIRGLIVEGLTLLCGSSKIGKSWLVLQMCCAIAAGKPFLGRSTECGDVLYLALEDSQRRLKNRLVTLGESPGAALSFATKCRTLDNGLLDDLLSWIQRVAHPRMIVIDTLQKVRGAAVPARTNAYAADYDAMARLKAFADKNHVAVVLVHHLNKLRNVDDPYDKISGSTGLMGAADTTVLIARERGSDDATVSFTGRDVWGDDFCIRMNGGRWEAVSREARERESYECDPIVLTCRDLLSESFGEQVRMTLADFKEAIALRHGGIFSTKNALTKRLGEVAPSLEQFDGIRLDLGRRIGSAKGIYITGRGSHDDAEQKSIQNGV